MTEDLFTIDPLHPAILKSYRATLIATRSPGAVEEIEFQSMHHATSWAMTCKVEDRVWIRGYDQHRFNAPVRIDLYPTADAMPDTKEN